MRIYAELLKRTEVVVSHKGEELRFLANAFTKEPFQRDYDVFDQINRYWAGLPEAKQDQIFAIYQGVHLAFDYSVDNDELFNTMNKAIKDLLHLHPIPSLQIWLMSDYSIVLPDTVSSVPVEFNDNTLTEAKTYTKQDYYPLLAVCMFFRTLVPIFGEYIASIREDTEMSRKELRAVQLMIGTGVLELPAMKRLQVYVNEITSSAAYDNDKILQGLSSEDYGFYMLALLILRRLFLVDLRGVDPKKQLIAAMFKFLAQRTFNGPDSNVTVKREIKGSESDGDTNKHSIVESFRKRAEISEANRAAMEYYIEDAVGIALRLEPSLRVEEIQRSIDSASELNNNRIGDIQIMLACFMVKNQITPRSLFYVSKKHNVQLLGALEAVLWKWGFKYLAVLITSHMVIGQEEIVVSNISSREQIDPRLVDELRVYYPFEWTNTKKGIVTSRSSVLQSIEKLVDSIVFNAWRATATEDKLIEVFGQPRRKVPMYSNIKNILAEFLIELEKKHIQIEQQSSQIAQV